MERIEPRYAVVFDEGVYGIFGKEETSGETVLIKRVSCNAETAAKIADMLNEKAVSVLHARDVILDHFIAFLTE